MAEEWLTTAEAARLGGFHVVHVRKLLLSGKLKGRKWNRDWQVSRASLLAYLRAMEQRGKRRGPKKRRVDKV